MRALERLVRQQAPDAAEREAEFVKLQLTLPIEVMELLQRAIRHLSQEECGPVPITEALECFAAECLSGEPANSKIRARLLAEARRDIDARRQEAEDAPEAPWEAAAAEETPCPGMPEMQLVKNTRVTTWENARLHFNEESRLLTAPQRREILRRDGYRCAVPGCPHHLWLQMHHVVFYCRGGATVPENLITVCSRCHRHIHRGLLKVGGQAPQGLRWFDRHDRELGTHNPLTREPVHFEEALLSWISQAA